jgi:hypothetical protein
MSPSYEPYGPPAQGPYLTTSDAHWLDTTFPPAPCSCGRTTRHSFIAHWFRLTLTRERW